MMTSALGRQLICFTLVFFYSVSGFSQPLTKKLDSYLEAYQKAIDVPSISAGVAIRDKIFWTNAYGYADLENLVPATPKTIYRIASISKSVTAVAIMQLVQKGKINLDEDIRKYIPYFPAKRWKVTTRQILSHTSGLRNYRVGEFDSKDNYPSIREAVNKIMNDSLEFEPGTKYQYTTLGYNILASIIEETSKQSFGEYLRRNIFEPSGMNATHIEYQSELVLNRARGYTRNAFRQIQNAPLADLSIKLPGGGLIATVEDLLKFSIALLNEKLISKAILDTMITQTRLKNGKKIDYGLGFTLNKDGKGRKYFSHSGSGTGFTSLLVLYPDDKFTVAHCTNIKDRNLGNPAISIASITLAELVDSPKIPISDSLFKISINISADSAYAFYNEVKKLQSSKYQTSIDELLYWGSDLLNIKRYSSAIKVFKFILNEYPNSVSALIGLGNAYFNDGNKGLALKNFRLVLKSEPQNKYAQEMIKKIE